MKFSEMTPDELQTVVALGAQARTFAEDEFFKNYFLPAVDEIRAEACIEEWHPGSSAKTVDEVAMGTAHASGFKAGVRAVQYILARFEANAKDAQEELGRRNLG